jgi:hypothetical protein
MDRNEVLAAGAEAALRTLLDRVGGNGSVGNQGSANAAGDQGAGNAGNAEEESEEKGKREVAKGEDKENNKTGKK